MIKVDNFLLESSGLRVENLLTLLKQAYGELITTERLVFLETEIVNSSSPVLPLNEFYLILSYAPVVGMHEDLNIGPITFVVVAQQGSKGFIFNNWVTTSNFNYLVHHFRIV